MNILEGINKIITKLGSDKKVDNITDGLNQISENISGGGSESGSNKDPIYIYVRSVDQNGTMEQVEGKEVSQEEIKANIISRERPFFIIEERVSPYLSAIWYSNVHTAYGSEQNLYTIIASCANYSNSQGVKTIFAATIMISKYSDAEHFTISKSTIDYQVN